MMLAHAAALLLAASSSFDAAMKNAHGLYDKADWDASLRELTIAEKYARTDAQRMQVLLFQGAVLANIPDTDAASAAWERALAIDANAELPVRVTPKIQADFSRLKSVAQHPVVEKPAPPPPPPPSVAAPPPVVATPEHHGPGPSPFIALGAGVVAGGIGVALGVLSTQHLDNARAATFANEKLAHYQQAQAFATGANVAYGAAGVAAVLALVLFLVLR
jgi:hypothetical protein